MNGSSLTRWGALRRSFPDMLDSTRHVHGIERQAQQAENIPFKIGFQLKLARNGNA